MQFPISEKRRECAVQRPRTAFFSVEGPKNNAERIRVYVRRLGAPRILREARHQRGFVPI